MKPTEVLLYALGAAAVGGGVYYLATRPRGASQPTGPSQFMPYPPAPQTTFRAAVVDTAPVYSTPQPSRSPAPASPLAGVGDFLKDVTNIAKVGKDLLGGFSSLFR